MKIKILFIAAVLLTAFYAGDFAQACTDLIISKGKNIVSARTMDFKQEMFTNVLLNPRGIKRTSDNLPEGDVSVSWVSKYGSLTMDAFGENGGTDGLNEHGLSAALLWLSETKWPAKDRKPALSVNYWAQYCLDNFKTVAEAVEALKKVRVYSFAVDGVKDGGTLPLHLVLHDAKGDSAVFEYLDGKLVIHHPAEQPVLTNDPDYTQQLKDLKNYKLFGGTLSLPGDTDPSSRFVRAASFLKTLPVPASDKQAVAWAFDVIKTVSVPTGAENTSGRENVMASRTLWTGVRDHISKVYYFNTVDDLHLRYVDLKKIDFSKSQPLKAVNIKKDVVGDLSSYFQEIKQTQ